MNIKFLNNLYFQRGQILFIALIVVSAFFLFQGNKNIGLGDEGYFWYGVQRVMLGEVPIRDFMGSDPAKYYFSASLMSIWGDNGIISLRITSMVLQVLGLFYSLVLIIESKAKHDLLFISLSILALSLWMTQNYKMVDYIAPILLIGSLSYLVKNPSEKGYFVAGVSLGFVAFIGRNHGVYGLIATFNTMLWLWLIRYEGLKFNKAIAIWALGLMIGFSPILLMLIFVPNFFAAYWDSVVLILQSKTTNLPLDVPWPWLVDFSNPSFLAVSSAFLTGVFFTLLPLYGIFSIFFVFWNKYQNKLANPILVSSSFLILPYAHYAFSRADLTHLTFGIIPLIISWLAILGTQSKKIKLILTAALLSISFLTTHINHVGWACFANKDCVEFNVNSDNLIVSPHIAGEINFIRTLLNKYAGLDGSFLTVPFWPGAYPPFNLKSPTWEIYPIWPRSKEFEQAEIDRIIKARPKFILLINYPLDGREELRFQNTHPLTYKYIQDNYKITDDVLNPFTSVYIEK